MKGIIYKITCNETGEVYIGSTLTKYLCNRIAGHKGHYKEWQEGKRNYTVSFSIMERNNYSYSIIEKVECENRYELEKIEGKYILENTCINKNIPGKTPEDKKKISHIHNKAYYEANKDTILKHQKAHYEANKDTILKHQKANKDHINELRRLRRAKLKEINNETIY